ncbi:MAG: asparagine synthase (glutamine-hydrolyzing) [Bacteroidetes bacterium]|nr:asparagine synthase (glutamine-hydrolyzing) [Bacteroidota bacterium]
MCGIVGGYYKTELPGNEVLNNAIQQIALRGPDSQGLFTHQNFFLGHRRLSIIDVSTSANQPLFSNDNRYAIIFNGEIYNYQEIKSKLIQKGFVFATTSDTEVLLNAYIAYGKDCLSLLNGFFAFAIHDKTTNKLFIARDRLGIKPLYFYHDDDKLLFASEMKALFPLKIKKEIDYNALATYLQLNYIPAPNTIYQNIQKLLPGHLIEIKDGQFSIEQYYSVPYDRSKKSSLTYDEASKKLVELLDESIQKRLVADVPLGTFLSGGIDSSVITSLAARHKSNLNTFSIGFKDNKYFDETEYAELVANKLKTNHKVFKVTNDDLLESLQNLLAYIDEPFADSSALLVNLLSKYTRQHVTVALSGDGGDELFAGYNKHYGEWKIRKGGPAASIVGQLLPLWKALPKSRNGAIGNKIRQLERFAIGQQLSVQERYWRWCSFIDADESKRYFKDTSKIKAAALNQIKQHYTKHLTDQGDLNDNLYADIHLVLPYDMLTKVDLMSMANSLEVRVPFLDHNVVEFAFSLPVQYKIDAQLKKKIVQDAFRNILPQELYNRPKKGFEVPLLQWFRKKLKDLIMKDLLADDFITDQGIFDVTYIRELKQRLFSNNPGDIHAQIWALIVFQSWYKNYHVS